MWLFQIILIQNSDKNDAAAIPFTVLRYFWENELSSVCVRGISDRF